MQVQLNLKYIFEVFEVDVKIYFGRTVAHSGTNQTSKMERFAKIVNSLVVNYFRKMPHLGCLTRF